MSRLFVAFDPYLSSVYDIDARLWPVECLAVGVVHLIGVAAMCLVYSADACVYVWLAVEAYVAYKHF